MTLAPERSRIDCLADLKLKHLYMKDRYFCAMEQSVLGTNAGKNCLKLLRCLINTGDAKMNKI
jgi:hypothetical protein